MRHLRFGILRNSPGADFETTYVDLCRPCHHTQQTSATYIDPRYGDGFLTMGTARSILVAANAPTIEMHTVSSTREHKSFGR